VVLNLKDQQLDFFDPKDQDGDAILKVFKNFFKEINKYSKKAKSRRTASHKSSNLKNNIHHDIPHTLNDQETGLYVLSFINSLSENKEITCGPTLRKIIAQDIIQNMEQVRVIEPSLKNSLMQQTEHSLLSSSNGTGKIRPIAMTPLVFDNLEKKPIKQSKSTREKRSKKSARDEDNRGSLTARYQKFDGASNVRKVFSASFSSRPKLTEEDSEGEKTPSVRDSNSGKGTTTKNASRSVTTGRSTPRGKRKTVALGTSIVAEEPEPEGDNERKRRISK